MRRLLRGAASVVVIASLTASAARARADELPYERQSLIVARALAYDANLKSRAGGMVTIAILYKSGNGASQSMADTAANAFKGLEGVRVQELPIKVTRLGYAGAGPLRTAIANDGIDALYVCAGLDADLGAIREVTRSQKVLTIGSREDWVQGGLALGVFLIDSKPTIMVHLATSKEEGAAFGSDFLRLARVIR